MAAPDRQSGPPSGPDRPSGPPSGPDRPSRPASGPGQRLRRVWSALAREERFAAGAAVLLWGSMFLPWYGKSVTETVRGSLRAAGYTLSAFGAFSFVEAAVLLVATSVLVLLFARGERRAFHLPGGDGGVIFAAGLWTGLLIFYRMLDKPRTTGNAQLTTTIGLQWGIFVAMAGAVALAYAGTRMRAARRPEPAPVEDPTLRPPRTRPAPSRRPDRPPPGTPRPTAAALGPVGLPPPGTPRPSAAPPRPAGRAEPEEDAPTEVAPGDSADPETEPVPPFDFEAAERTRRRSARRRGPDGVPEFDPFGER